MFALDQNTSSYSNEILWGILQVWQNSPEFPYRQAGSYFNNVILPVDFKEALFYILIPGENKNEFETKLSTKSCLWAKFSIVIMSHLVNYLWSETKIMTFVFTVDEFITIVTMTQSLPQKKMLISSFLNKLLVLNDNLVH